MIIEGEQVPSENSTQNFSKISDFIFIVRDSFIEKDEETLTEKEWYIGYIAIFNLIFPNKTHDNRLIYDEKINSYLNKEKANYSEREEYYAINSSNFCFVKIEFYQNGDIKNIYLPKGFLLNYYSDLEEIIKLLIPKISSNLYVDSIEDKLNEIININPEEDDNSSDNIADFSENTISDFVFNNEEEEENRLRNLNIKSNPKKKYNTSYYVVRMLSDNTTDINDSDYRNISVYCEDYLTPSLYKSINYELREAKPIQDSIYHYYDDTYSDILTDDFSDLLSDNYLNNNVLNISHNNYSNLTECSIRGIENDDLTMEGALVNTTIYSLIDDYGFLQYVIEKSTSLMKVQTKGLMRKMMKKLKI